MASFNQQKTALEKKKKEQEQTLSELLKTYYITKQHNDVTPLLNPGEKEQQDRISQYYQHLAKARAEAIQELNKTSEQLEEQNRLLVQEQKQIEALLSQQTSKLKELASSQSKRKQTVNKIRTNISSDKHYLAELQRNETRLKSEIAKAAKRAAVPMDGLARQRGRLPWPLRGKLLHTFGSHQSGQITWKGVVINAEYGEPVKAVYSGTVVFAEYLRGYGLVILLDHGKGDMTLYGYNQTLLKKEGDKIKSGEIIALAGDTGGQSTASLYFEIRRNSQAQNPTRWLTR